MRPPTPISAAHGKSLERLVRETKNTANYKRVRCVWLRAAMALPPDAIARALGLSVNTVRMVQSRYLRKGEAALLGPGRGGRRRENILMVMDRAGWHIARHLAIPDNIWFIWLPRTVRSAIPRNTCGTTYGRTGLTTESFVALTPWKTPR